SAMVCGMSSALVTRKWCLVIGSVMPQMSASWSQADVLLVHGEAASAREAYREQGAATPGDPHLLAGWLLAHTALHPGHRRLLARPERFAAAVEGEGPEVWEHAAHRLATPGSPV
ncbi:hypothetical protein ABZ943_36785, partial [Streptomyces rubiginosohelvolus]